MVFLDKVDPDDSLLAAAPRCLSHHCPFVGQLGARGGIPRDAARPTGSTHCWGMAEGESSQSAPSGRVGETRHFWLLSVLHKLYHTCQTARPEGHEDCGKADDRESEGAEDATKVQKKTLLVSDWFVRGQIDPGSSAGK